MSKGKKILYILQEVRIEALKSPSLFSVGSDLNSISEEEAEERIAGLLILALRADGYDLSDYTKNIEISITFNRTIRDIYDALKKEQISNKSQVNVPIIDIDEDEIPF
ncbi:hypothetical protein [Sulfurimonas sp. NW15]|uniref:hypothetical protein n=1 Tax=unclassified Sulfurimonas TaxID=2623549 RepID=UPI003DA9D838